jgi:parallel beta-helix repeat protein
VSCGATITGSVTLSTDVGPCPGNGLVVKADNVTVNLAGHRLFGTAGAGDNRVGIQLAAVNGVTVTGGGTVGTERTGDVDNFASGIAVDGGSHNTVTNVFVHDNIGPTDPYAGSANYGDGIVIGAVSDSSHNLISDSSVVHNGIFDGVAVFGVTSKGNRISNNHITDNNVISVSSHGIKGAIDDGVNLGSGVAGSNATTIDGNTISRSGQNGIDACSAGGTPPCLTTGNVITGNVITENGTQWSEVPGVESMGINISDLVAVGPIPFPATNDLISGNRVLGNLGVGIFVNNPYNTISDNVALGNSADRQNLQFGGVYDLYDNTYCSHNNWHGNSYDVGEAYPTCTTQAGHAVTANTPAVGQPGDAALALQSQPRFERRTRP